ncbi:hypothetical protein [Paenibacillus polymyxa]|uniref:hypothetical protein n=2 Tax=Paenibacillus polymyxa TaxID=1406 RepID=UPI0020244822|nr:hypothetical protein [Paenibacillus polymyxa]MEB4781936.1 hypothetical protein [Paenibacillus jamilae]URJ63394.3 hypothetical protein MF620_002965 [Paenibacillus polymyxa]
MRKYMLEAKECEDVKRIKAGIISCGNTSSVYLKILQTNPPFEVVTFGDLLNGRAKERVDKLSVENVYKVDGSMLRLEMELAFICRYLAARHCRCAIPEAGKQV